MPHLIDAHDLRQAGDYGAPHSISCDQRAEQIEIAEKFIHFAERVLGLSD